MLKVVFTRKAINDIKNIYDYVYEDSLKNAESLKADVLKRIKYLEQFPNMGKSLAARVGFRTEYRYLISESYLIFYKLDNNLVKIYRVISSNMDYIKILFN